MGAFDSNLEIFFSDSDKNKILEKANSVDKIIKSNPVANKNIGTDYSYKHEVVWKNAIGFLILHFLGLWGLYLVLTGSVNVYTAGWSKYY